MWNQVMFDPLYVENVSYLGYIQVYFIVIVS